MAIKELNAKKDELIAKCRAMNDRAGDRPFTPSEQTAYDEQFVRAQKFGKEAAQRGELAELQISLDKSLDNPGRIVRDRDALYIGDNIRAYRSDEPMADRNYSGPGIGAFVRGIVTGRWASEELRALAEGSSVAGGFLVPDMLSKRVIDLARTQAVCVKAGAVTVPMENATLKLGRLLTDPVASWRGENAAINVSDPTFGQAELSAKSLACIVKMSREIVEDASNIDGLVNSALSVVMGLELDRACLFGTGLENQPLGLTGYVGLQSGNINTLTSPVGSLANYDAYLDGIQAVMAANGPGAEGLALIQNPRTYTKLAKLKTGIDGDETALQQPEAYRQLAKFASTAVPINLGTGTDSQSVVGDFTQMLIGVRQQISLEVSTVAADANGSAFTDHQLWIKAVLRADMLLQRPTWFTLLGGISA